MREFQPTLQYTRTLEGEEFYYSILEKGIKLALKEYYEKKKNNPDTYHIAENELNNIGISANE